MQEKYVHIDIKYLLLFVCAGLNENSSVFTIILKCPNKFYENQFKYSEIKCNF